MKITIKGYLTLRKTVGDKGVLEMEMKDATIRDVLSDLSKRSGPEFRDLIFDKKTKDLSSHIIVLVNGHHCKHLPNRLDTELQEGDEISLFPPVTGG